MHRPQRRNALNSIGLGILVAALAVVPVLGQKTTAAESRAAGRFVNNRDVFLRRAQAMEKADLDAFEAAAKKVGIDVTRQQLFIAVPTFNPLFDSSDKLIPGAVAKFSTRLQLLPPNSVDDWKQLTGADPLMAAMSLTAEDAVFPGEKFSAQAFVALKARLK